MEQEGKIEAWLREDFKDEWRSLLEDETEPEVVLPGIVDEEPVERERPRELAVVEKPLPDGLFGFTRRDWNHVVVNNRLYEVDKERTVQHEKMHHRFPHDELTIRYLNGDLDVENTLSFAATKVSRIGSPGRSGRAAAYGSETGSGYDNGYV